jgi:hypothetical protein
MKTISQQGNNATGPQHKIEGLPSNNRCNRGLLRFQQMKTISQKKSQGASPLNASKKKQVRPAGGATFRCFIVFAHCEVDT